MTNEIKIGQTTLRAQAVGNHTSITILNGKGEVVESFDRNNIKVAEYSISQIKG